MLNVAVCGGALNLVTNQSAAPSIWSSAQYIIHSVRRRGGGDKGVNTLCGGVESVTPCAATATVRVWIQCAAVAAAAVRCVHSVECERSVRRW